MNYFNKLPTINYNGFAAKNLLARAVISDTTQKNDTIFYPYTIQEDDGRADNLSQNYYDSPGYSWLIWHTNNIIDPYFGTPLNELDLYWFIDSKYGSFSNAERKIAFYRSNWATDSRTLTTAQYSALPPLERKYWDPQLDLNFQIIGYERRKETRIVNTNKIVHLGLQITSGTGFVADEKVSHGTSVWGWSTATGTDMVMLQHITGTFSVGSTVQGETSGTVATITSATVIQETQAAENPTYWESVSYAQFEREENEKKRDIRLLDNRYKSQIESELKRVMKST